MAAACLAILSTLSSFTPSIDQHRVIPWPRFTFWLRRIFLGFKI
jgi:hypothetical protein